MSVTTAGPSLIYVLMGSPGSGKGTFAQALHYESLSTGNLLRKKLEETEFGNKYKQAILGHVPGGIPLEVIQSLVNQRLVQSIQSNQGVVLDGYPKNREQCALLDDFIHTNKLENRVRFVFLEVDAEEAIGRIGSRLICGQCQWICNALSSPPKTPGECDQCHGSLCKRMDDNLEGTIVRVQEFHARMKPVTDYYSESRRLIRLDGSASPKECSDRFTRFHRLMQSRA